MTKRVLYIMDPFHNVDPQGDTTLALIWESQQRGFEIFFCEIHELGLEGNAGFALCRPFKLNKPPQTEVRFSWEGTASRMDFDDFQFVWMRKDPPVDQSFITATLLLDHHNPKKTLVLNHPTAMRVANEKLWAHFAADLYPRTLVSADQAILLDCAKQMQKIVLKPIDAAGGFGIFVFGHDDKNLRSAIEVLTQRGKQPIVMQAYLNEVAKGDKRVLMLGGEIIGALQRLPGESDHRANLHVGGKASLGTITPADEKVANRLKPHLEKLGLHFVGFDMIGDRLTEVNVTSPTGIREINHLENRNGEDRLESIIWDFAVQQHARL